ncbi:AraC family transcriptional regulator [Halalkalibacter kiskunsagensis]|uniref:AraC family transcriptional regulator n=1 Tax=Halalkalibacter kiskunsagensis TaxID=1548599 RepID=A0ABV6KAR0_9BACI
MIDNSQKQKIEELQTQIHAQFEHEVLHILNGQMMYEQFSKHELMKKGQYVPFNEAMCSNETTNNIFSNEFNHKRASGHQVSLQEYEEITITPLKSLFEHKYKCIVLWFGDDMFCQMNLLTALALLEQERFKGKVRVHMINEVTDEVNAIDMLLVGYKKVYEQVLIHHHPPEVQLHPVMELGMKRYLEYKKEENEITNYIKERIDMPWDELLNQLFQQFPHYGLGDLQYINLIKAVKET